MVEVSAWSVLVTVYLGGLAYAAQPNVVSGRGADIKVKG